MKSSQSHEWIFMGHESHIYFRLIHFMTPEKAVTASHVFHGSHEIPMKAQLKTHVKVPNSL